MSQQISYRSPTYYETVNPESTNWRDYRDEKYREYRKQWEKRPRIQYHGDFPLHIDIDPTNACNLRCTMCPRTHYLNSNNSQWAPGGKIGFMEWKLFTRVIDMAGEGGAYSVKLNYLGEPLLHPDVVEQVRHAKRRGLEVMMNTNATLLTEEMSLNLLEAGLDDIFFSVDSPYAKEYEEIRIGADFEQVIRNIETFVRTRDRLGLKHVQTRVSMVEGLSGDDVLKKRADFRNLFYGLGVAETGFGLATDMETDYWAEYGFIPGFSCPDIYTRMFVYWDGKVGPCCGEWERGLLLGDAYEMDLGDIWLSDKYGFLRKAHEESRYDSIGICRKCSVPWLSTREIET